MPDQGGPFTYPPLPPDADAIRILILSAGNFNDPLECMLTSTAFGEKPAYVALSYTWGFPYPDMSEMHVSPDVAGSTAPLRGISTQNTPYISNTALLRLNNQLFPVGPNLLLLALLHLRSPKYTLPLWVDAICINQADTEERNRQVSLMSYIYTRAIKVVAWLGTQRYKNMAGLFRIMSLQWKAGHTRHLRATIAEGRETRCSPQPTKATLIRISKSTYWTCLWIVQEVCLP
ncbi:heterokaryon incompatibility protein (HET) domain-containing protein [Pochonia chlamydosporia 170]|uniref:Heterokaryon incompatibility protein (HET) domain-containing protein n=1 Tax=Pochonia chlamydosporia 170 TaxID=1380566 RepID=A0A219APE2_METCM|nr:heterokaryon incompatibility protein (HET) domain-containing protein [Pochonia chlamydosporia 170]OWT42633.1 heterokaryon incompatibility protein (HET) domain-containing protein [Pochonia chlamydosporia 170]